MNLLDNPLDPAESARQEILSKWKDKPLEDVLKAKVEADLHIKAVEREKAELRDMYLAQREELLAKAKFEEYIDQIRKPPVDQVTITPVKEVTDSPRFDPMEFKKLASDTYQEFERQKIETDNFKTVESKLKERFGDNYSAVLKDQQSHLGLSSDEINNLAKKSPEAFFRLMGLNDNRTDNFQSPPRSGQRIDNFAPKGAPKRGMSYYEDMKKTNPKLYLDPKISQQMERDALAMGWDAFSAS